MTSPLKLVAAPPAGMQKPRGAWNLYLEELRDLERRVRISGLVEGDPRCALLAETLADIDADARTL